MKKKSAYLKLEQHFARIQKLQRLLGILSWDQAVMMPEGAVESRSEEIKTLVSIVSEWTREVRVLEWIEQAQGEVLNSWQKANLREIKRAHEHARSVPLDLVQALTKAAFRCEMFWRSARLNNDYPSLMPSFKKLVQLVQEEARIKADYFKTTPYQALFDGYEPGMSLVEVDRIFKAVKAFLPDFIEEVLAFQRKQKRLLPIEGPFPKEKQQQWFLKIMKQMGFDFQYGRLDESAHPFCAGSGEDIRITTRYQEKDFFSALYGVIHETGHALYEGGLSQKWRDQPVGGACSIGIHESQSLLMEKVACQSKEFFTFLAPWIRNVFSKKGKAWGIQNLYQQCIKVKKTFIRVFADEVTYPMHVVLRYELERDLIEGKISIKEIPELWRHKMKQYLGIVPKNNQQGCLQDIHWFGGSFGYFPCYTLGAIAAAQIFEAGTKKDPDLLPALSKGDFKPLRVWLRKSIHSKGRMFFSEKLLKKTTGRSFSVKSFENYLRKKYLADLS